MISSIRWQNRRKSDREAIKIEGVETTGVLITEGAIEVVTETAIVNTSPKNMKRKNENTRKNKIQMIKDNTVE